MSLSIVTTEDGSSSVFNKDYDEHYHSVHGAIQESEHVFIGAGLKQVLEKHRQLQILEIGFGTGLNALLTYINTGDSEILYTGVEKCPLQKPIYQKLNYPACLNKGHEAFISMHDGPWNEVLQISTVFSLKKIDQSIEETELSPETYHLVYFDAFAPQKQPEIWKHEVLLKIYRSMSPGGILTTYCAQGQFRRNLRDIGFEVERLDGPPGKFEMVRAVKAKSIRN